MKYYPKNYKPDELLKIIGFKSANRGWVLKRKYRAGKPVQVHALPDGVGGIDLHADYDNGDGKHVSKRYSGRDVVFMNIFRYFDENLPRRSLMISNKILKNYPTLNITPNLVEDLTHKCCDGDCNHDDCCGKVEANCPLKDNK